MKNIKALIIEDDESAVSALELKLNAVAPEIEIAGTAGNVNDALTLIKEKNPGLLFLDVELPDGTGFDVINRSTRRNFKVIFTTAHNKYAVRAFELAALHYLKKPVDEVELKEAVKRFPANNDADFLDKLGILKESLIEKPQKIMLPDSNGLEMHNISDIVRCEAEGSYTKVIFRNNSSRLVARGIKSLEENLRDLHFSRVHNSHLVNLKYVKKYVRGRSPHVELSNGETVTISDTKKEAFLEQLNRYATQLN